MSRRDGVLIVLALWGGLGYLALLFLWPLLFGPLLIVALFALMMWCALFVWPGQEP